MLDDGYNSLANTGSTQSNLSAGVQDGRCHTAAGEQRPSSGGYPNCSTIAEESSQDRASSLSASKSPASNSLQFSHVTCPLLKPDGASDDDNSQMFESTQSDNTRSSEAVIGQIDLAPPPVIFADKPAEGPRLTYQSPSKAGQRHDSHSPTKIQLPRQLTSPT